MNWHSTKMDCVFFSSSSSSVCILPRFGWFIYVFDGITKQTVHSNDTTI